MAAFPPLASASASTGWGLEPEESLNAAIDTYNFYQLKVGLQGDLSDASLVNINSREGEELVHGFYSLAETRGEGVYGIVYDAIWQQKNTVFKAVKVRYKASPCYQECDNRVVFSCFESCLVGTMALVKGGDLSCLEYSAMIVICIPYFSRCFPYSARLSGGGYKFSLP